jgi:SOS-response transcriptional repressor LexA
MTPAQKEIFLVIDEWWKTYGYGPTVKEVMMITGEKGEGNVHRKMRALVALGVCKGVPRRARSIRPSGLRVRSIE